MSYMFTYVRANIIYNMNECMLYLKQWSKQVIYLKIYNKIMMDINIVSFLEAA